MALNYLLVRPLRALIRSQAPLLGLLRYQNKGFLAKSPQMTSIDLEISYLQVNRGHYQITHILGHGPAKASPDETYIIYCQVRHDKIIRKRLFVVSLDFLDEIFESSDAHTQNFTIINSA